MVLEDLRHSLIAWSEYASGVNIPIFQYALILITIYIGGVTFSGSLVAYGKLAEKINIAKTSFVTKVIYNNILHLFNFSICIIYSCLCKFTWR